MHRFDAAESIKDQIAEILSRKTEQADLDELFDTLIEWCRVSERKIVLMIDEVDYAMNSHIFFDFLARLRDNYISRNAKGTPAFHSVILAGVNDLKHLKSKFRPDDDCKENSPWNIAADFNVDMSLSESGIKGMLDEYEVDHHTGMNTTEIAAMIWMQTSGYPFLVSRICQLIDKQVSQSMKLSEAWSRDGVNAAIKILLSENNTLFQSLTDNLNNYPQMKSALRSILMEEAKLTFNSDQKAFVQMEMYGFIKNANNMVRVANKIFEVWLCNLFLSDDDLKKYE